MEKQYKVFEDMAASKFQLLPAATFYSIAFGPQDLSTSSLFCMGSNCRSIKFSPRCIQLRGSRG
jgi:hypothetical protein